jgi:tetratricopeptide (TPR) repeat protein
MRSLLIGLALTWASTACLAQTLDQDRAHCMSHNPDVQIGGCTADILSGQESEKNLAVAYGNRAAAYDSKGLHDKAIADSTLAIKFNPDYGSAYNERAWAYHGKHEDLLGLPDAQRAVALAPDDAFSIETRAEIYEALGRRDEAMADYRAALKLDPNLQPALDGLRRVSSARTR